MKRMMLSLTLLVASYAVAAESIDEIADVHPRGEVEVSNVAGTVTVEGWDRDQVKVGGELGRGAERLEFRADGRHTLVKVIYPKSSRRSGGTDLVIRVPVGSRLSVNAVSADIEVTGVEGAQRLQSVSGNVTTEARGEDVRIETVSGDLSLRGHGDPVLVSITTVSGDVDLRDLQGEVNVQSVTGDVDLDSRELERLRIRTTNGDVEARAGMTDRGSIEMEAINGDLRLDILGAVDAEFDIETFNGSIRNDFGPEPRRKSQYQPGTTLRFTEGEGNGRVRIKTLNGGITLRGD